MTRPNPQPEITEDLNCTGLSCTDKAKVWTCVALFVVTLWSILIGSLWMMRSPWHLLAAFPATIIVWLVLRESVMETAVIFVLLLFLLFISKTPADRLRTYLNPSSAEESVIEENVNSAGSKGVLCTPSVIPIS